jgi:PAS domain S-box-containing protein
MFVSQDTPLSGRYRIATRISVTSAAICILAGVAVMAGWQFGIWWLKSPVRGTAPVAPSVAIALVLCGLVLLMKRHRNARPLIRAVADLVSIAVTLFSAATIVEYAFGLDLHIDGLAFAQRLVDWPLTAPTGRMSLATAIGLMLSGLALLLLDEKRECYSPGELCAAGVLFVAFASLLGYFYQVESLYTLGQAQSTAAVHTALLTGILGIGIVFARTDVGLAAFLVGRDAGAIMSRRLFAATVIAIPVIGFAMIHMHMRGWVDLTSGIAIMVMSCSAVFAIMIFSTANTLRSAQNEREHAMAALSESEERLRIATSAAQMGVWLWDLQTDEVFLSEKASELFGLSFFTRNLKNETLMQRIHSEDRERVRAADSSTISHGSDYENEYRVQLPGNVTRWLAVKGRGFNGGSGRRVVGVVWDTTERKQSEMALVRSEKLASVGRMAATMAHEINNPLAAVTNVLYLVAQDPSLSEQAKSLLSMADEELRRVTHITKQTLGFYREHSTPMPVEVAELIKNVRELYNRRLEHKHVRVLERFRSADARVRGIAGELRQVVSNLISNSIDALSLSGALHLRTAVIDNKLRITIADTGTGISSSDRKRVFEPFFTTKEAVGTGLGLWITKEIIDKHHGHIRMRSRIGRGTVFCIFLPAERAPRAIAAKVSGSVGLSRRRQAS